MKRTMYKVTPEGFRVELVIDPHNYWPDTYPDDLVEGLGILPYWAISVEGEETFAERFKRQYGFWVGRVDKGKTHVTDEGIYQYPEDPDLYPIMKMEEEREVCYFYQYALVAIVNKEDDGVFVTRMD